MSLNNKNQMSMFSTIHKTSQFKSHNNFYEIAISQSILLKFVDPFYETMRYETQIMVSRTQSKAFIEQFSICHETLFYLYYLRRCSWTLFNEKLGIKKNDKNGKTALKPYMSFHLKTCEVKCFLYIY